MVAHHGRKRRAKVLGRIWHPPDTDLGLGAARMRITHDRAAAVWILEVQKLHRLIGPSQDLAIAADTRDIGVLEFGDRHRKNLGIQTHDDCRGDIEGHVWAVDLSQL